MDRAVPRGVTLQRLTPASSSTPDPSLFAPDTLWEKINSEAEFYRRFHLVRAACRRYSLPGKPDETLEMGVYLLSPALDAFGLFSFFSPDGAASWPYGNGAVAEGHQGFFRHGTIFVTVDGFGEVLLLVPAALRIVADRIGPSPPEIPVLKAVREIPGAGGDFRGTPPATLSP